MGQVRRRRGHPRSEAHGVEGITPAHANIIPFVAPEGIQIGELARLAKVRKQSMAQSVELLVASGYVTRRPDPNDGRASLIFLTDKGRALGPASHSAGHRVERGAERRPLSIIRDPAAKFDGAEEPFTLHLGLSLPGRLQLEEPELPLA